MTAWLIAEGIVLVTLVLCCAYVPSFTGRLLAALTLDLGGDMGTLHVKYLAMQQESRRSAGRLSSSGDHRLDRERGRSRVCGVGHHASLPPLHRRAAHGVPRRDDGSATRLH